MAPIRSNLQSEWVKWFGWNTWGSLLLAIYGAISFLLIYFFHGLWVEGAREIFVKFKDQFPKETQQFLWAYRSDVNIEYAVRCGLIAGILSGIIIYLFANSGITGSLLIEKPKLKIVHRLKFKPSRVEYFRDVISSVFILISLSIVFSVTVIFVNRSMTHDTINLFLIFANIIIVSGGVWLYVFYDAEGKRRRDFLVDKDLQMKQLEFELERLKEFFHILTGGLVSIILAALAGGLQYYYQLPKEVVSSRIFEVNKLYPTLAGSLILLLGFSGFILGQVFRQMGDLLDALRDYDRSSCRKNFRRF